MLTRIQQMLDSELKDLDLLLRSMLKSRVPLLNIILDYLLKTKGKQIRPVLVFLSARIFGPTNTTSIVAATMIELLHTATLVHDDVVDEADTRRGFPSIFAKWKTKVAILTGDFMLSKGLLVAIQNNELELLRMMSESVEEMSEGELIQLERSKRLNITEQIYYDIISKKTATLIKTACAAGCYSVTRDPAMVAKAAEMGHHIGMAFQIKDDLLDLGTDDIGKPKTNDIRENKLTLPLIYTLDNSSLYERILIKGNLRLRSKSENGIQYIIDKITEKKGIAYSQLKMQEHAIKAMEILQEFPQNEYTQAMKEVIEFTVERKS